MYGDALYDKLMLVPLIALFFYGHPFVVYFHPQGSRVVAIRPHLRILEPSATSYDEVSNDALSIRGFQGYRCNDYHLGKNDRHVCFLVKNSFC